MSRRLDRLSCLARDERGLITVHNLFFTITVFCVGALAVDVTRFYEARTQLQVSADLAAHAALYTRRYGSYEDGAYHPLTDAEAEAAAITAVEFGSPVSYFGATIDTAQIELGYWNYETGMVQSTMPNLDTLDAATQARIELVPDAAAVVTDRAGVNAVGTAMFYLAGLPSVNVATGAVFALGPAECTDDQGFFSEKEVRINTGSHFFPGFCVSAPVFEVQNGNFFRPGTTTQIPGPNTFREGSDGPSGLDVPNDTEVSTKNPGLLESVQFEDLDLSATMNRVNNSNSTLASHFQDHDYAYWLLGQPNWTSVVPSRDATPIPLPPGTYRPGTSFLAATGNTPGTLAPNGIYSGGSTCTGTGSNSLVTLDGTDTNNTYRNMVILTPCKINFSGNVRLEDTVISTTLVKSGGGEVPSPSIQAPSSMTGFTIGKDDDCAPGGGAALITRGSVDFAAKPNFFGALVRAVTGVDFQSKATGEGVSIMSNGLIRTNSEAIMEACGAAKDTSSRNVSLNLVR